MPSGVEHLMRQDYYETAIGPTATMPSGVEQETVKATENGYQSAFRCYAFGR